MHTLQEHLPYIYMAPVHQTACTPQWHALHNGSAEDVVKQSLLTWKYAGLLLSVQNSHDEPQLWGLLMFSSSNHIHAASLAVTAGVGEHNGSVCEEP